VHFDLPSADRGLICNPFPVAAGKGFLFVLLVITNTYIMPAWIVKRKISIFSTITATYDNFIEYLSIEKRFSK